MRAGRLDRRIAIQRLTRNYSESGEPVDTWSDLAVVASAVNPVSGDERFAGDQWVAKEQVEFFIRWSPIVAGVGPLDRVIYPLLDATASPPETAEEGKIYDIMAAPEIGRHKGIRIMAARRSDVLP